MAPEDRPRSPDSTQQRRRHQYCSLILCDWAGGALWEDRVLSDLGPLSPGYQGLHVWRSLVFANSADYSGQGVDQLQKVIDTIKTNPNDRRIILCAWNPKGRWRPSHPPMSYLSPEQRHWALEVVLGTVPGCPAVRP